jgi:asparagine synthase (glutamine-hydrolysing)
VKALHAAGVPAAWDEQGLVRGLTVGLPSADQTLFRDVRSIPPAHFLLVKGREATLHKYWDFDFVPEHAAVVRSSQEHAEELHAVLDEAVRLRLRADVPVGCYLSGGVDSCSILGLMARNAQSPVRAFTLGFDDPGYDESAIAKEMAEHAGADLTVMPITDDDLANNFSDALWHAERFAINAHGVAKFILSGAVHEASYKAVLTGEGADEVFAGYPHFRLDLLRFSGGEKAREAELALAGANSASCGLLMPNGPAAAVQVLNDRLGYAPAFMEVFIVNAGKVASLFHSSFSLNDAFASMLEGIEVAGQMSGRHVVNQSLYFWNKTFLHDYILTMLGDRMEMAHSVEGRLPFLDHHVVEFARNLPIDQKINGSTEKFILREAMDPVLTKTVKARQKHPFAAPPSLLRPSSRLHAMLQDTLRGQSLSRVPCLNKQAVTALLDRLPQMTEDERGAWEAPMMFIFSSCILAERFRL